MIPGLSILIVVAMILLAGFVVWATWWLASPSSRVASYVQAPDEPGLADAEAEPFDIALAEAAATDLTVSPRPAVSSTVRVYDLAHELDVPVKVAVEFMNEIGLDVVSHLNSVSSADADWVLDAWAHSNRASVA